MSVRHGHDNHGGAEKHDGGERLPEHQHTDQAVRRRSWRDA
ncbi:hypothetical protein [Nonomuraea purpurea]